MNREEAIEVLQTHRDIIQEYYPNDCYSKLKEALNVAVKTMKDYPEWIPCSERPPEEKGEYFISYTHGVDIAEYNPNMYGDSIWSTKDNILFKHNSVMAWIPLLEPYKAGSEDKE